MIDWTECRVTTHTRKLTDKNKYKNEEQNYKELKTFMEQSVSSFGRGPGAQNKELIAQRTNTFVALGPQHLIQMVGQGHWKIF